MRTLMSWVKQKATPNLKEAKAETRVARPSLMTVGTQPMLTILEVKGAATEASAVLSEIPGQRSGRAVSVFYSHLHAQS